jgi:hypothetical protein
VSKKVGVFLSLCPGGGNRGENFAVKLCNFAARVRLGWIEYTRVSFFCCGEVGD